MHATLMYCFSYYLALKFEKHLQYSIDIATEQNFRYMELTNMNLDFHQCIIMLGFRKSGHK